MSELLWFDAITKSLKCESQIDKAMSASRHTPVCLLVTLLLVSAISPLAMVQAQPTETSEYYYGVEYDWASLDNDVQNVTGLDLQALFMEIMSDASDAGFNLDIGQLTTGATNVFVHQTEDISSQTIQDLDGADIEVWSRTSDITLRHGILSNAILLTDWSETTFGSDPTSFDIGVIAEAENVLTVDILYTEYLNDAYELIGADMDVELMIGNDMNLAVDIALEGGGEDLAVDFDTGINFEYTIASDAVWRLGMPSPIYIEVSQNPHTVWSCNADEQDPGVFGDSSWEVHVWDVCGMMDGTYTGSAEYEVYLTGLPTEEFGFDAGQFDFSLSDAFQDSGSFEEDAQIDEMSFSLNLDDVYVVNLGDGTMMDAVACDSCPPGNPVMFGMLANVLVFASTAFAEAIAEDFEAQLDESLGSMLGDLFGSSDSDEDWEDSDYYWECDNGELIYEWNVNDGYEDCEDGSDEMDFYINSGTSTNGDEEEVYSFYGHINPEILGIDVDEQTEPKYFECNNGDTIPWYWINDDYADCEDGEDEAIYEDNAYMECQDGSETIPLMWVNDGEEDCDDGSDESQYDESTGEETTYFICADGTESIVLSWVNDGWADCTDGSDESDLVESSESVFICDDGEEIPFSYVADDDVDCADGSDEDSSSSSSTNSDRFFYCADYTSSIPWQWVNDGAYDCEDESDEYDSNNPADFYCYSNGATISFEFVNDGDEDCDDGSDEGSAYYLLMGVWMYDDESTLLMDANNLLLCSDWMACDVYFDPSTSSTFWFQLDDALVPEMPYGEVETCVWADLYDANEVEIDDIEICSDHWTGPSLYYAYLWSDGYELHMSAESTLSEYDDVTMNAELFDENGATLWSSEYTGYDGEYIDETFDVGMTGEYCLVVTLIQDGATEPFATEEDCDTVSEQIEPSDRLGTIFEAFADSGLQNVLEAFGENLEQTFSDVAENEAPIFPYVDGVWAPLWSQEHATIIGVAVYAWDEDGNGYVIAGPETTDFSQDLPLVFASIRYITGVSAQQQQQEMAEFDSIEDIVDVEQHDLSDLADALEAAGADTSILDLDSTDNTDNTDNTDDDTTDAEDVADGAGLLPFVSPLALVAMIGLAAISFQPRRKQNE